MQHCLIEQVKIRSTHKRAFPMYSACLFNTCQGLRVQPGKRSNYLHALLENSSDCY
ncbi:hypothetical protein QUB60_03235 [Microcoleus sp. A2-C5]|uniref:hypothetical protein n=1 Tax=unclassified Microcoleus TaxID=2642155 RepID=UPI002FCF9556